MDGIYLPDHGQEAHERESESFSVGVFFFILFDMAWVRYGYDTVRYGYGMVMVMGMGIWYMVLALGRTKDIRHGTRMKYIYHEEGGGGTDAQGTYIPTSF